MNTIWFFGDSITKGTGVLYGDEMYDSNKKIFARILGEKLGYNVKNFGVSGACNEWIVSSLLKQSQYFKKGDIVVACNTGSWGYIQFLKKKNKVITVNDVWIDDNDDWFNSQEEKDILMNYRAVRKKYHLEYYKFFKEQYKSIEDLLISKDIHMVVWDFYEWWDNPDKYERITAASKGKVRDQHFSYKGHESMANHILGLMYDKFSFLKKPLN